MRRLSSRVLKGNSKPFVAPELPDGVINPSDPDSRVMRTPGHTPPRQAYNAQTTESRSFRIFRRPCDKTLATAVIGSLIHRSELPSLKGGFPRRTVIVIACG